MSDSQEGKRILSEAPKRPRRPNPAAAQRKAQAESKRRAKKAESERKKNERKRIAASKKAARESAARQRKQASEQKKRQNAQQRQMKKQQREAAAAQRKQAAAQRKMANDAARAANKSIKKGANKVGMLRTQKQKQSDIIRSRPMGRAKKAKSGPSLGSVVGGMAAAALTGGIFRKRIPVGDNTRLNVSYSPTRGAGASASVFSSNKTGLGGTFNTKKGLTASARGTGVRWEFGGGIQGRRKKTTTVRSSEYSAKAKTSKSAAVQQSGFPEAELIAADFRNVVSDVYQAMNVQQEIRDELEPIANSGGMFGSGHPQKREANKELRVAEVAQKRLETIAAKYEKKFALASKTGMFTSQEQAIEKMTKVLNDFLGELDTVKTADLGKFQGQIEEPLPIQTSSQGKSQRELSAPVAQSAVERQKEMERPSKSAMGREDIVNYTEVMVEKDKMQDLSRKIQNNINTISSYIDEMDFKGMNVNKHKKAMSEYLIAIEIRLNQLDRAMEFNHDKNFSSKDVQSAKKATQSYEKLYKDLTIDNVNKSRGDWNSLKKFLKNAGIAWFTGGLALPYQWLRGTGKGKTSIPSELNLSLESMSYHEKEMMFEAYVYEVVHNLTEDRRSFFEHLDVMEEEERGL